MRALLVSVPALLASCDGMNPTATVGSSAILEYRADWAELIADSGITGVFVLWEPDSFKLECSDTVRVNKGFLPASTFKDLNWSAAVPEGAGPGEHTLIPWDSIPRRLQWNENMDMVTAIERSCVPWYQEAARRAGAVQMQHWLDTVHYGNAVMGDSIHLFWLQGGLRISPLQQVYFMQKLSEEHLPFDIAHQRIVKRILPGDSTATWRIRGKTGWAIRVEEQYGWYVGWVERGGRTAYFATNIDMHGDADVSKRQALTRALLVKEDWLDQDAL